MSLFNNSESPSRTYDTSDGSPGPIRTPSVYIPSQPATPLTFGKAFWAVFLALCAYGILTAVIHEIVIDASH